MQILLPSMRIGRYFRGNLHGHSTHSDGEYTPEQVIQFYHRLGYDFTCLSDHLWTDSSYAATSVLDASALCPDGFLTIPSAELHCRGKKYDQDGLWHIVANGLPLDFKVADETETGPEMVSRALAAGAFVSIAHPEWYSLTSEEALSVSHAHAVEIYNHSCFVESQRYSGIMTADQLLQEGKQIGVTATDDSHFRNADAGGGWVMVAANSLSQDAIISALKNKHYYASTGPDFHGLYIKDKQLVIECSAAEQINLVGAGYQSMSRHGPNLTRAEFDLSGFHSDWFRITILAGNAKKAWSNPYWISQLSDA